MSTFLAFITSIVLFVTLLPIIDLDKYMWLRMKMHEWERWLKEHKK